MLIKNKDFYEILKDYLESYPGNYNEIIDYCPDLLKLLADILNEKVISPEYRLKICAALGYFVAPLDVIPETIYGPEGYIDDLFISIYVINEIIDEYGYDFIVGLWSGEEELDGVLENCYDGSESFLGDKKMFVLKYVGFE